MSNEKIPRISIIIPVYNVEKWLRDCLDSVVIQNSSDFEVILVNDGSTDSSMEIMEEYGSRYPFFHTYTKQNGGLSSARNYGMSQAHGKYIYFLDSDDKFYDEKCVSFLLHELENELDIIYFDAKSFFETQELENRNLYYATAYQRKKSYGEYEKGCDLFAELVRCQDFYSPVWLACYRKSYLEQHGLFFDDGYVYEDNLFTFKSILQAGRVCHKARTVLSRRIRYGSIMQSTLKWLNAKSYFRAWMGMKEFWKTHTFASSVETAIGSVVDGLKAGLIRTWQALPMDERQKITELSAFERHEFETIMPTPDSRGRVEYIFPYSLLPQNASVAIYGAGKVGTSFYRQALHSGLVNIVAIVDSNAASMPNRTEPVQMPNCLKEIYFDIVLISVENKELADKIRTSLHELGVPDEKIKWYGRFYRWNDASRFLILPMYRYLQQLCEIKQQKFWLMLLPEHGNMGDYAIGYAAQKFLQENFPDIPRIDVTDKEWNTLSEFIRPLIQKQDVIFFNGGGNLGDLWSTGAMQRSIVEMFPENKIVFLPNTLTYRGEISQENDVLMQDIENYKKKTNVYICFREQNSYTFCQKYLNRIACFPDMVLGESWKRISKGAKQTALLCFRNDEERVFQHAETVRRILRDNQWCVEEIDVHQKKHISQDDGKEVLRQIVEKIQSVEVVITDRLHGMLLSVVSQVPCIAFDNRTKKLSGVYSAWLRDIPTVRFVPEENVESLMELLVAVRQETFEYVPMKKEFQEMAAYIREILQQNIG